MSPRNSGNSCFCENCRVFIRQHGSRNECLGSSISRFPSFLISEPSAHKPNARNVVVKCVVSNCGTRAGFVSARTFQDESLRTKIGGSNSASTGAKFHVEPADFVLGVNESQTVVVAWDGSGDSMATAAASRRLPIGFLALFHGDEVMRARLKKVVAGAPMPKLNGTFTIKGADCIQAIYIFKAWCNQLLQKIRTR